MSGTPALDDAQRRQSVLPRAAYLHVPFCRHRCGYCNFTLIAGHDDLVDRYLNCLAHELALVQRPRDVDTLFVGGGTPTHLEPDKLARLLELARHWFPLARGGEFSIEANPNDLTGLLGKQRGSVLAAAGVTRVSLGAQSFHADKLRLLERDHGPAEIRQAVELARGFAHSVSLDLIFGAPGESLDQWQADLDAALEIEPDHVSTYGLTFERGTRFWSRKLRGELVQLPEEIERDLYALAIDHLTAAGLEHYEVSNFARAGHRCRHNEVYWAGEEYYAAGPGAARYVGGRREVNHRSTLNWMARLERGQSPVAESETLDAEDRARELLVLALRRRAGIGRDEFRRRTGLEIDSLVGRDLARYVDLGLVEERQGQLRLTRAGLMVSDALWPNFLRR
ncbi:MAG: radical SAM family heme chaperone HemW [Pirellulales bacterium]|nr:radical SAM family heme chaperone HemW [Pirellulales bacterium]